MHIYEKTAGRISRLSVLKKHIQKMFNSCFRLASRNAKVIQRLLQVHQNTLLFGNLNDVRIPETVQVGLCDADVLVPQ